MHLCFLFWNRRIITFDHGSVVQTYKLLHCERFLCVAHAGARNIGACFIREALGLGEKKSLLLLLYLFAINNIVIYARGE